jgi:N-acetylglucosamine kinase-like BadF-type ATPase
MKTEYYIGIDAGGTTWDAVLCRQDNIVLAENSFDGLNLRSVSNPRKIAFKLQQVIADMADLGSLLPAQITLTTLAGAGAGNIKLRESLEAACQDVIPQNPIRVVTDADAALEGAFEGGAGIIVIAGTGSISIGKDSEGNFARSGGYGYIFGDEGSGFWIGKRAVQTCLEAHYKGDNTPFLEKICLKFEVKTINEVLNIIYSHEHPAAKTAEIAPIVFEAADSGDEISKSIIKEAGEAIGLLVKQTADKLKFEKEIKFCLIGGLSKRVSVLKNHILSKLPERFEFVTPQYPPTVGAVILGKKLI